MNAIGYIINESTVQVNEVDIVENGDRVTGIGKLQTGDETNRNGRRYRTEDLAREIVAPRQRELVSTGNMLGEAGHPLDPNLSRQQTIDPKNVCVRYLKMWMEGNDVMAHFQGTNNDLGECFDKDLRSGVKPAFSLRALGTVSSTPEGNVVENLKIITYDYVIFPSHPGAYTEGIVNESVNVIKKPNTHFDLNKYPGLDATRTLIESFDVNTLRKSVKTVEEQSAIDYIKDYSKNFNVLSEFYDINQKNASIDLISKNKISITEAGKHTVVVNVEDYIAKELRNYR
nr:MAG TPA: Prohead core protein serine protease [Caudoviricetes sp.]